MAIAMVEAPTPTIFVNTVINVPEVRHCSGSHKLLPVHGWNTRLRTISLEQKI